MKMTLYFFFFFFVFQFLFFVFGKTQANLILTASSRYCSRISKFFIDFTKRQLRSVHTSTHKVIIKTSVQSYLGDMVATDSPCLPEGSPFQVTSRRQAFISLGFQIIFSLPENPIKEYSSHFSFVTRQRCTCLQKSMISRCPIT